MINIITGENRHLFHPVLTEMHRQRKQLFIDQMGWSLADIAGLEMDDYDSPEAVYLVETGGEGAVLQSARLLPTQAPHLLSEVFPGLCDNGPPRSETIWEASRFCPAPDTEKGFPRRQLLMRMIAAILETSLLFGVEGVTFVASAALAPLARKAGWEVSPLGGSQRFGRERLTAMLARVTSAGLQRVRAINGLTGPLTRYADINARRAA